MAQICTHWKWDVPEEKTQKQKGVHQIYHRIAFSGTERHISSLMWPIKKPEHWKERPTNCCHCDTSEHQQLGNVPEDL